MELIKQVIWENVNLKNKKIKLELIISNVKT